MQAASAYRSIATWHPELDLLHLGDFCTVLAKLAVHGARQLVDRFFEDHGLAIEQGMGSGQPLPAQRFAYLSYREIAQQAEAFDRLVHRALDLAHAHPRAAHARERDEAAQGFVRAVDDEARAASRRMRRSGWL